MLLFEHWMLSNCELWVTNYTLNFYTKFEVAKVVLCWPAVVDTAE